MVASLDNSPPALVDWKSKCSDRPEHFTVGVRQRMKFQLHHTDAHSSARRGTLSTPQGSAETPTFMPVGTLGTVKGVPIQHVEDTGAEIVLGNTYHLTLRPGEEIVAQLGGLHTFMQWPGLILTDSGGFQIFSLAQRTKINEEGAVFQAHTDGRRLKMTPESSLEIQRALGSDIAMVLDHVVALPNEQAAILDACDRTIRWAERSRSVVRAWAEPNETAEKIRMCSRSYKEDSTPNCAATVPTL